VNDLPDLEEPCEKPVIQKSYGITVKPKPGDLKSKPVKVKKKRTKMRQPQKPKKRAPESALKHIVFQPVDEERKEEEKEPIPTMYLRESMHWTYDISSLPELDDGSEIESKPRANNRAVEQTTI